MGQEGADYRGFRNPRSAAPPPGREQDQQLTFAPRETLGFCAYPLSGVISHQKTVKNHPCE